MTRGLYRKFLEWVRKRGALLFSCNEESLEGQGIENSDKGYCCGCNPQQG
jgi:hypothetical protein